MERNEAVRRDDIERFESKLWPREEEDRNG
jgi:hypothetical protein